MHTGKTWAAEGKCGQRIADYGLTTEVCRKSCQVCTPMYMAGSNTAGAGAGTGAAKPAAPLAVAAGAGMVEPPKEGLDADGKRHIVLKVRKDALPKPEKSKLVQSTDPNLPPPPKIPEMTEKEIEMLRVDLMISKPMTVDPEFLQKEFRAGRVPDYKDGGGAVVTENNLCEPVDHADAQLLSRITVASSEGSSLNVDADGKDLRIFCGIYTMEANHETNVKATRNTWAKKCDGFIAFSTKEDATIPSVAIMHEGKEAYDNMWQKSRSIWKYVYTHLRDKYDYFLLGGDDMFYIVENLRAYLGSEEITTQRKEREGKRRTGAGPLVCLPSHFLNARRSAYCRAIHWSDLPAAEPDHLQQRRRGLSAGHQGAHGQWLSGLVTVCLALRVLVGYISSRREHVWPLPATYELLCCACGSVVMSIG